MIHKYLTNNYPTRYKLPNLLAVFDSTELSASNVYQWFTVHDHDAYYTTNGPDYLYDLNWFCNTSSTEFTLHTDTGGYPAALRTSSNTNIWYLYKSGTQKYLSSLMDNNQFSIQMTCTFADLTNYKGMMGLHTAGNYDGLIGGQYENGYVKFGIYSTNALGNPTAYTINIPSASMPTPGTRFNWALTISGTLISLYINGILYNTINSYNTINMSSTLGVTLGCSYINSNRFTTSYFYSILLYNKELTQDEIYHNYLCDKIKYGLN